jgi:hypothetical protein
VVEAGEYAGLSPETTLVLSAGAAGEHLDGDIPLEAAVAAGDDQAVPAAPQNAGYLISGEGALDA